MLANPQGCVHDVRARRSCNLASRRRGEGIVGCVGTLFAPNYEEDGILS